MSRCLSVMYMKIQFRLGFISSSANPHIGGTGNFSLHSCPDAGTKPQKIIKHSTTLALENDSNKQRQHKLKKPKGTLSKYLLDFAFGHPLRLPKSVRKIENLMSQHQKHRQQTFASSSGMCDIRLVIELTIYQSTSLPANQPAILLAS